MKTRLFLAALAAFALPPQSRAEVTIDLFYDALDPYGKWIEVGDYGYCWQPDKVGTEWRPYSEGEWAYTDAGWTWISVEPFGWATYHYGRWARLARRGWVWVPDTQWAPAWVSWRHSDRYTGWAPLPPESRLTVGVSLGDWVDSYYEVGPTAYSFVETRNLGAPLLASVLIAPRENVTIIRETRNVTNVTIVNNVVVNNGPAYEEVSRRAERPIRRLRLERVDAPTVEGGKNVNVEGETVRFATPRVTAQAAGKPRKVAQRVERVEIDKGWQNAGTDADLKPLREKMKTEAKVPADLPPKPAPPERARATAKKTDAAAEEGVPTSTKPPQPDSKPTAAPSPATPREPAEPGKPTASPSPAAPRVPADPAAPEPPKPGTPPAAVPSPATPKTPAGTNGSAPQKDPKERARPNAKKGAESAVESVPKLPKEPIPTSPPAAAPSPTTPRAPVDPAATAPQRTPNPKPDVREEKQPPSPKRSNPERPPAEPEPNPPQAEKRGALPAEQQRTDRGAGKARPEVVPKSSRPETGTPAPPNPPAKSKDAPPPKKDAKKQKGDPQDKEGEQ